MPALEILRLDQRSQWNEIVRQSVRYDFYHFAEYHTLAEERGEGIAHLFIYKDGPFVVALPLLLRPVAAIPGLEGVGEGWSDATSVYGYAGPIASHTEIPAQVLRSFRASLDETLRGLAVVAVFSRLHPLIPQRELIADLGEYVSVGRTISIDLTLTIDQQRAQYRKNHKIGINKLTRLGATCIHDRHMVYLTEFVRIYHETMRRVGASDEYLFERDYYEKLAATTELGVQLFVCVLANQAICGGLFTLCDGIVQYHLGATRDDFISLAPMKLAFDTVRLWSNERGAHVMHLGGGVGAQEDSLFHFKAGFSDRRHDFAVLRWIVLPDSYESLCQQKNRWNEQNALKAVSSGYFPAYGCPAVSARTQIEQECSTTTRQL